MRLKLTGLLVSLAAVAAAAPASAQVVINEILANPGSTNDGAEFIELYNTTGSPVDISGWVLTGTEFAGLCTGDHDYAFPPGTTIGANGYIVVAKDNADLAPEPDDGFLQRFGFDADFELYDPDRTYDFDDPSVPNMILTSAQDPGNDTQIGLLPGRGFGASCSTILNQADVLRLENSGGTLIDHLEYGLSATCGTDPCLGLGTSDTDAFPMFPGVGESVCRNATGTDTNNCSADFFLGSNTPGAANIPNAGPLMSGLGIDPSSPTSAQSVTVSILATDVNGIGSLTLHYTVNGGAETTVAMPLSGVDTYAATIPAQLDNDIVDYWVTAVDGGAPAGYSKYPDYSSRSVRWGTQSIFSVQFHSPPSDTGQSAEVGNPVNVEGIVTAEPGLYNNNIVVIQSAAGFWNGVHCFDPTATVSVARGDLVRVSGTVEEYFEKTEVLFFGNNDIQVLSTGNALPGPDVVTAASLATLAPLGEAYEGGYVRIQDVVVTNQMLDNFGEWEISDGSGACRVDDDAFYNYNPTNGDSLVAIQGIVDYTFSNRKLEPRDDGDIIGPPIITTVRYAPVCPPASTPITVTSTITDDGSLPRVKLYFSTNNGATYDSTDMVNTVGTTWSAGLGSYTAGQEVDYHIEVTDNTGFPGRSPAAGDYDLYVGEVTIETVQSTFSSGTSDSSAFEGSPRNLAGIVTVAPGVFADNVYTIQNNWATDPAFRAIQVFSGGSLVGLVSEGDSVCVSGDIDEFFGLTQLRQHFTDSYVNYGFVGTLPAFDLATTDLPPDSTGAVPAGEAWESVLVQMSNSVVTNATVGFGQYFIDNTSPRVGQETLVDDEARFGGLTYSPTLSDSVSVRGMVTFSFGEYKINPRGDFDILPYDPADAVGVNPGGLASLSFALHQNSPNPSSGPATRIGFAVPRATNASLRVFDVTGRLVATLVDGQVEAGAHVIDWNGRNADNHAVSSGVYFYRLQADGLEATRKMVILK